MTTRIGIACAAASCRRGARRALLALAALAPLIVPPGTAAAIAADAGARRDAPWRFRLRAGAGMRYDDNILSLSERDRTTPDRFGLDSAGDLIVVPGVALTWARSPRRGRETDLRLTLRAYDYQRNSIRDHQEVVMSLRQELNRGRAHRTGLDVGVARIPRYFLRELVDEDASQAAMTTVRNDADYARNRAWVTVSQKIVDRVLAASAGYACERRNYNDDFDERDSGSAILSADLRIFPLRRAAFRVRPYGERERRGSRGDLAASTGLVDDDVGFDSDLVGIDLRWLWGPDADHRNVVRVWFEDESRSFTTSAAADSGHFDRRDDITQYGADYDRELGGRLRLAVSWRRRQNDVSRPDGGGGRISSRFEKDVVGVGLVYRFSR